MTKKVKNRKQKKDLTRSRPRVFFLVLPLAIIFLFVVVGSVVFMGLSVVVGGVLIGILVAWAILIDRQEKYRVGCQPEPAGVIHTLTSPEVSAAILGSMLTIVVGGVVASSIFYSAEERAAIRDIATDHYQQKVKMLEEFSDKGQKIMYYATSYRLVEEWIRWHDQVEKSKRLEGDKKTQEGGGPKITYGIGRLNREEAVKVYKENLEKFITAGSMDGMCRAIDSNFFNPIRLENDINRSLGFYSRFGFSGFGSGVRNEETRRGCCRCDCCVECESGGNPERTVNAKDLSDAFDAFLQPTSKTSLHKYGTTSRKIYAAHAKINEMYNDLIKEMYKQLERDRGLGN